MESESFLSFHLFLKQFLQLHCSTFHTNKQTIRPPHNHDIANIVQRNNRSNIQKAIRQSLIQSSRQQMGFTCVARICHLCKNRMFSMLLFPLCAEISYADIPWQSTTFKSAPNKQTGVDGRVNWHTHSDSVCYTFFL